MKKCITTKKELIEHIENNFPDTELTITLSKKFNFSNWLTIVLFSSIFVSGFTFLIYKSNSLESLFISAILSAMVVKFYEFKFDYQVK